MDVEPIVKAGMFIWVRPSGGLALPVGSLRPALATVPCLFAI
jgi:hypothetical protein